MSRLAASWPWIALIAAAVIVGVSTGARTGDDSPYPSTANPGPKGAQVLHTWLIETGGQVESLLQPLTAIPNGIQVLVIAAPSARDITSDEVKALETFVEQGGTLLYLAPRPAKAQPAMQKWLGLTDVQLPLPVDAVPGDVGGMTIGVGSPLLPGVRQLRVAADTALEVEATNAVEVAGKSLWVRPMGKGQVWIAAGADLIENRRLDLLDNLKLWRNLRPLRIAFDEFHHGAAAAPQWSANLWASLLQAIFVGLLFVAARARRLGPARPTPDRAHRSSREYLTSMGALMQRAGVEGELKLELRQRLRRLMQDRLGIAITLDASDASRGLADQTGLAADAYLTLERRLTDPTADFAAAAAEAALLEDVIVGRNTAIVGGPPA